MRPTREPVALLLAALAAVALSGVGPTDRATWWLEVLPVLLAAPLLLATHRRFPLTPLSQRLIFVHALILVVGAHWTYAHVPLGEWARDAFDLSRNPYDKLGHFAQGFVPAVLTREVLLRTSPLRPGRWLAFLVVSVCLAISAFYELLEWWAALIMGADADAFLGTQGDPWDTQSDMALAGLGAICALLLLRRVHDRALARLT